MPPALIRPRTSPPAPFPLQGTVVTAGRCQGIVTGTGAATAIGKIRDAMAGLEDAETPLRKKLDELGSLLSKVCLI